MPNHHGSDPIYVMGRSADETLRLQERARFFEPLTRHLFQDAGIGPGMRVLDIGSGPGDVSFLAAELVGPTGSVVGVDANPEMIRTAIRRAEASGLVQVSFMAGDIRDLALEREFDAVVGRLDACDGDHLVYPLHTANAEWMARSDLQPCPKRIETIGYIGPDTGVFLEA